MSEYVKHEIMLPKELSEKIPKGSRLVWEFVDQKRQIVSVSEVTVRDVPCVGEYRIVIEPAWTAPDWMPKGWWLAMDADGEWVLHKEEPTFHNGEYWWNDDSRSRRVYISEHFVWTPPSVDGAEDSLRQI